MAIPSNPLCLHHRDCHQTYLVVRHELLKCLVKRQYSGLFDLTEALTAVRSKGVHFGFQTENAISLLDNWRHRGEIRELNQSLSNRLDEPNGLEEIIKLLHFHKMMCFFLEDYSINTPRPPWIQPVQWENKFLPLHLLLFENCCFLRAMCRFQTLKNKFRDQVHCFEYGSCDPCRHRKSWQLGETDELRDIKREHGAWHIHETAYQLFYGTIPPWEHEELGSVFNYLLTKIKAISKDIADDLRQLSKSTPCDFF